MNSIDYHFFQPYAPSLGKHSTDTSGVSIYTTTLKPEIKFDEKKVSRIAIQVFPYRYEMNIDKDNQVTCTISKNSDDLSRNETTSIELKDFIRSINLSFIEQSAKKEIHLFMAPIFDQLRKEQEKEEIPDLADSNFFDLSTSFMNSIFEQLRKEQEKEQEREEIPDTAVSDFFDVDTSLLQIFHVKF